VNPFTAIAIYLTVWWTVLFVVLPLGARSHAEDGQAVPGGGDPASPVLHNMRRKLITTTWVSALIFAVLMLALKLGWSRMATYFAGSA
jgi:predicted secreted protein